MSADYTALCAYLLGAYVLGYLFGRMMLWMKRLFELI